MAPRDPPLPVRLLLIVACVAALAAGAWWASRRDAPPRNRTHPEAARALDVNAASYEELLSVPGVTPRLARAILAERASGGPFARTEDLRRVRGIGPKTLERLQGRLQAGGETDE